MQDIKLFDHPDFDDHEQVVFASDRASGLRAIVAIHDTTLGPALGGCRMRAYASEAEALADVLRLSRGMSYKAALAGLALGGGKSVVLTGPSRPKSPALLRAMGRAVDRLGGRYITAEDVGTGVTDMELIAEATRHVVGRADGDGDPSPSTARGVFLCLEAALRRRLGRGLAGAHVAVKGLGHVGFALCGMLHAAGARLTVADIDETAAARARAAFGAVPAAVEEVASVRADAYAPCALGGDLDAASIPRLRAAVVCGSANNQLAAPDDDDRLARAGVLYCPDYLVNAGGLISAARAPLGLTPADVERKIATLPVTLDRILAQAEREGLPPGAVADRIARARFRPAPEAAARRSA